MSTTPEFESDDAAWPRRALLQRLESLQRSGVTWVAKCDLPAVSAAPARAAAPRTAAPSPAAPSSGAPSGAAPVARPTPPAASPAHAASAGETPMPRPKTDASKPAAPNPAAPRSTTPLRDLPVLSLDQRHDAFVVLRDEVRGCTCCPALVKNRTQTVFGVGALQPRLCFFGEAPGADEDAQGEPFVGRAGQLLNDIIKAMGLRREDVYILNVLKCRPPDNRPPEEQEAANCRHFFERQLEVLQPEFICCLGASAAKAMLDSTLSIGKLRGRFHQYRGAQVLATYHPAYLLRNPSAKKDVWVDIQMLMQAMGLEPPRK